MLSALKNASLFEALLFFLLANVLIFLGSVLLCRALGRLFHQKRLFACWEPLRPIEVAAALGSVLLNSLVSLLGWTLWVHGIIVLPPPSLWSSIFHCAAMLLFMDLGMYAFHRLAHAPFFFRLFHGFHHRHESTNPISLFVLHPVEVIGFGCLMILYLVLVPTDPAALVAYLTLNVLWGTLGHSGVEPLPARFSRIPLLRWGGTSTFHAEHHEHPRFNFGFYTLIWDRLFGTLDPEYEARFRREK